GRAPRGAARVHGRRPGRARELGEEPHRPRAGRRQGNARGVRGGAHHRSDRRERRPRARRRVAPCVGRGRPGREPGRRLGRERAVADADALQQDVPVRPRAVVIPVTGAGAVSGPGGGTTVVLPANLVKSGSRVAVVLSPGLGAVAAAAAEGLYTYPYGCTEQTANGLRSGASPLAMSVRTGSGLVTPDLGRRIEPLVDRLNTLRHGDGAWGWWSQDDADPYLTAMAIEALARAASAGIAHDAAIAGIAAGIPGALRTLDDVRD